MKILLDYSEDEIKQVLVDLGMKKFRAKQVYEWLTSYVDFDEMSNISKEDREILKQNFLAKPVEIYDVKKGSEGTLKWLLRVI